MIGFDLKWVEILWCLFTKGVVTFALNRKYPQLDKPFDIEIEMSIHKRLAIDVLEVMAKSTSDRVNKDKRYTRGKKEIHPYYISPIDMRPL